MSPMKSHSLPAPTAQRGVVLIIALIVLVAMTLVAIGTVRSVDTGNVLSANLALKAGTVSATDRGAEAAYRWLISNAAGATLQNDDPANGYFSARPGAEPDWSDPANWGSAMCAGACAADANGNSASYLIHRMCSEPNTAYNGTGATGQPNQCATTMPSGGPSTGGSMNVGANTFQSTPQLYYRITSRVVGPRNSVSVVQVQIAITP